MINPFREQNWNPDRRERRRFARSLVIGCPCIAIIVFVLARWRGAAWSTDVALAIGAGGGLMGLILWTVPQVARPVYVVWFGVACAVGLVMGNALLTAVYLLLFAPIGMVRRAAGRGGLSKGFDRAATSYWRDAPPQKAVERYYRQF
jgi:hypothetical protein